MKINFKALLVAFITGSIFMVLIPIFFVILNNFFRLPTYNFINLKYLGIILIFGGIFLFLYSSKLFQEKGLGTPAPMYPPKKLVIDGLYKYSRNPIYIGYLMIFVGMFFYFGFLSLLIYAFLMYSLLSTYIYFEEKKLAQRFGQDYLDYKLKVRRWF